MTAEDPILLELRKQNLLLRAIAGSLVAIAGRQIEGNCGLRQVDLERLVFDAREDLRARIPDDPLPYAPGPPRGDRERGRAVGRPQGAVDPGASSSGGDRT